MGPVIVEDVENKLMGIHGITKVYIEVVFNPPWGIEMLSEEAKLELGIYE